MLQNVNIQLNTEAERNFANILIFQLRKKQTLHIKDPERYLKLDRMDTWVLLLEILYQHSNEKGREGQFVEISAWFYQCFLGEWANSWKVMTTSIFTISDQIWCFSGKSHKIQKLNENVQVNFCSSVSFTKRLTLTFLRRMKSLKLHVRKLKWTFYAFSYKKTWLCRNADFKNCYYNHKFQKRSKAVKWCILSFLTYFRGWDFEVLMHD